jgi:hypothetical protein
LKEMLTLLYEEKQWHWKWQVMFFGVNMEK